MARDRSRGAALLLLFAAGPWAVPGLQTAMQTGRRPDAARDVVPGRYAGAAVLAVRAVWEADGRTFDEIPPVLVQLEADRPALLLGQRLPSYAEACLAAPTWRTWDTGAQARLLDERSCAAWSYSEAYPRPHATGSGTVLPTLVFGHVLPGLSLCLRVRAATGKLLLEQELDPFLPDERREIAFELPRALAPLTGRVLDAGGRPAAGLEVMFGSPSPALLATTDLEGRFAIKNALDTCGTLLLASTRYSLGCGGTRSVAGRDPTAVLFEPQVCFEPGKELALRLGEPSPLWVRARDANAAEDPQGWEARLYEAETGLLLCARYLGSGGAVLPRPAARATARATIVELFQNGASVRRLVPALAAEVELLTPVLGALRVKLGTGLEACPMEGVFARLQPQQGPELELDVQLADESCDLDGLPPGAYDLRLWCYEELADPGEFPLGPAVRVEVQAGRRIEVAYP